MTKLTTLSYLIVAIICGFSFNLSEAYFEQQNQQYIASVLEKLNNEETCFVPTFDELDELNLRFVNLEKEYGSDYLNRLTEDQKLLLSTVLDNWESYKQKAVNMIPSARKRSNLKRVVDYQERKHGSSICRDSKIISDPNYGERVIFNQEEAKGSSGIPKTPTTTPAPTRVKPQVVVVNGLSHFVEGDINEWFRSKFNINNPDINPFLSAKTTA